MTTLTRQELIDRLSAVSGPKESQAIARWAFDQFYAEEAGEVEYEPGFRRVIATVLDDLMFGDAPGFELSQDDTRRLIEDLQRAEAVPDDAELDDEDDDDLSSS